MFPDVIFPLGTKAADQLKKELNFPVLCFAGAFSRTGGSHHP
jgi:hypothetical protein